MRCFYNSHGFKNKLPPEPIGAPRAELNLTDELCEQLFYHRTCGSLLLELSRYAAKTFSVSNVLCESVRKPQACLKVRADCNLPTALEIKENLRVRVLTMTGFMI